MAMYIGDKPVVKAYLGSTAITKLVVDGKTITLSGTGTVVPPVVVQFYIWDTDIDSDCDDIAATALMLGILEKDGGQLIAATIASNNIYAAPALKVLLNHAGLSNVPIGAYKGTAIGGGNSSKYTQGIVSEYHNPPTATRADFPDAVPVLRQALANVPDGSVRLIIGGTCTNIAALLQSVADGISPLNGVQLVEKKVSRIDVMGGRFNAANMTENNVLYDIPAANTVASLSPVPVYWAGWEVGNGVATTVPQIVNAGKDPYRRGWELYAPTNDVRDSWDLMSVITSMRDTAGGLFTYSPVGDISFTAQSYSVYNSNPNGRNRYVIKAASSTAIRDYCNAIIKDFLQAHALPASAPVTPPPEPEPTPPDPTAATPKNLVYEYLMNAGAGAATQYIVDSTPLANAATRGGTTGTESVDPTWTAQGLSFDGGDYGIIPYKAEHNVGSMVIVAVARMRSQTGDHQIVARDAGGTSSSFQLRTSGGVFQFVGRGASSTIRSDDTMVPVPTDRYMLFVAKVDGTKIIGRKNGVKVIDGTLLAAMPTNLTIATYIGARQASSISNRLLGDIAYLAMYGVNDDAALPAIEQRAIDAVAAKGITVNAPIQ